jgi:energy-converting hydrogenase Eha subunit F
MKFLTKLGQIVAKVTQIATGIAPLFPQYDKETGRIVDTLNGIAAVVMNVEVFGTVLNTPGEDKLKAATPAVAQIMLSSDLLVGKKIKDAALFKTGVEKVTAGMADILNSIKEEEIGSTDIS